MRRAWDRTADYENKYGSFTSYIECEGVMSDMLMDVAEDDAHEGDILMEMTMYAASAFYAGEGVTS